MGVSSQQTYNSDGERDLGLVDDPSVVNRFIVGNTYNRIYIIVSGDSQIELIRLRFQSF